MRKLLILTSTIVLAVVTAAAAAAGARIAREGAPARDFARPMNVDANLADRVAAERLASQQLVRERALALQARPGAERNMTAAGHHRHAVIPVTGYIVSMDPATHDLTIKVPRHGELVLEVVHASQLEQNGERIRWGALKTGDKVQLDYTKFGSTLIVDSLSLVKVARR